MKPAVIALFFLVLVPLTAHCKTLLHRRHYASASESAARDYQRQQAQYAPSIKAQEDAEQAARQSTFFQEFFATAREAGASVARFVPEKDAYGQEGYVYREDGVICRFDVSGDDGFGHFQGSINSCADGSPSIMFGRCDEFDHLVYGECQDGHSGMEFGRRGRGND